MSQEQPGWWKASDRKWSPPESQPVAAVPPPPEWARPPTPPPSGGLPTAAKVAIGVIVGILLLSVLSVVAIAMLREEESSSFSATDSAIDDGTIPSTAVPVGKAYVPEGYSVLQGEGVAVAMPESWAALNPDHFSVTAEQLTELFPNLDPAVAQNAISLLRQGAVLFAANQSATGISDNLIILSFPGETPLSALRTEVRNQLESQLSLCRENACSGGLVESIDEVELPSGDALRVQYRSDAGGAMFHGVQLYVPSGGRTYVVTLSSGRPIDDEVAGNLAESFRIGSDR